MTNFSTVVWVFNILLFALIIYTFYRLYKKVKITDQKQLKINKDYKDYHQIAEFVENPNKTSSGVMTLVTIFSVPVLLIFTIGVIFLFKWLNGESLVFDSETLYGIGAFGGVIAVTIWSLAIYSQYLSPARTRLQKILVFEEGIVLKEKFYKWKEVTGVNICDIQHFDDKFPINEHDIEITFSDGVTLTLAGMFLFGKYRYPKEIYYTETLSAVPCLSPAALNLLYIIFRRAFNASYTGDINPIVIFGEGAEYKKVVTG